MANICSFYGQIVTKDPTIITMIDRILKGDDLFRCFHRVYEGDVIDIRQEGDLHIGTFNGCCAWSASPLDEGDMDGEFIDACMRHRVRMECVSLRGLQEIFDFGYYLYYEEEGNACVWDCARNNLGKRVFENYLYDQKPDDWYDEDTNPDCEAFEYYTTPYEISDLYMEVEEEEDLGDNDPRMGTICVLPNDNPYKLMEIYSEEYETESTSEVCPYCDEEVEIPIYGKSFCPNCGKEILPCSMCANIYGEMILQTCHYPCPYVLYRPHRRCEE